MKLCKHCKETLLDAFREYDRIYQRGRINQCGFGQTEPGAKGRDLLHGILLGIQTAIEDMEDAEEESE